MDINKRKKVAIEAAKKAGKILRDNFHKVIRVKNKKDGSLVTNVDLEAEKEIISLIERNYSLDSILSEENSYPKNSEFKWIIDPLDGTHDYIRGIESFGTSIALEFNNEVVLGILYLPFTKELYVAEKGKGAYLNGKRIEVSKKNLEQATMIYDSHVKQNKLALSYLEKLGEEVFNIRTFGSTVRGLSYIAEGKADLEINYNDKVWDFAAGLLLIEEAGGKVTDFQGKRWNVNTLEYIASNGKIHKIVLEILNKF